MAPGRSQPLYRAAIIWIAGDGLEVIDDIIQPHGSQAVEQAARVVKHDTGLFAFVDQLGNELTQAFVTSVEDRGIMVVADIRVIHHVFQIADDGGRPQVGSTSRDQWLVHVQCDAEGAAHAAKIDAGLGQENGSCPSDRFGDEIF